MARAFDWVVDERGIAHVAFDLPGKRVNLWTRETLDELEAVLGELEARGDLAAIVFRSGKPGTFIAGADVGMLAAATTADAARALSRRGQAAFGRVADLAVPTVAAIHGACVGGGLEFALACSFRLASDDPATRLGFPEVQLGIVPAWGGTQRAPRAIGLREGLGLILTARRISARSAERIGLVDQAVPAGRLLEIAEETAIAAIRGRRLPAVGARRGVAGALLEGNPLGRKVVLAQARKAALEKTGGHYPAPLRAIDAVGVGLAQGMEAGLEAEADAVAALSEGPVARNLMGLYLGGEAAKRPPAGAVREVRRLGILGAGVMGGALAEVAAVKGILVRMKDVDPARVAAGLAHAASIARAAERRGSWTARQSRDVMNRISGTTSFDGFRRVDLVVEAIVEDLAIKRSVLAETERASAPDTVLASNTSSLRIDDLDAPLQRPEAFGGLHLFNPVERMPLVEVVRGERTSDDTVATLHAFARAIGKTPIVVRDAPGFWVNRLLTPYLAEAVSLWAAGLSTERIDDALEEFGLPMGPLALLDEVGLDVAAKVARVLEKAFPDRMKASPLLTRLESTGRLGKKAGLGFYRHADGKRSADPKLRADMGLAEPRAGEAEETVLDDDEIVARTLYPMVNEAARALDEGVVASAGEGDLALVLGIGWPPFRGGLLRWADDVGLARIAGRLDEWAGAIDPRFTPAEPLRERARTGASFHLGPRRADGPPEPVEQPSLGAGF